MVLETDVVVAVFHHRARDGASYVLEGVEGPSLNVVLFRRSTLYPSRMVDQSYPWTDVDLMALHLALLNLYHDYVHWKIQVQNRCLYLHY